MNCIELLETKSVELLLSSIDSLFMKRLIENGKSHISIKDIR